MTVTQPLVKALLDYLNLQSFTPNPILLEAWGNAELPAKLHLIEKEFKIKQDILGNFKAQLCFEIQIQAITDLKRFEAIEILHKYAMLFEQQSVKQEYFDIGENRVVTSMKMALSPCQDEKNKEEEVYKAEYILEYSEKIKA